MDARFQGTCYRTRTCACDARVLHVTFSTNGWERDISIHAGLPSSRFVLRSHTFVTCYVTQFEGLVLFVWLSWWPQQNTYPLHTLWCLHLVVDKVNVMLYNGTRLLPMCFISDIGDILGRPPEISRYNAHKASGAYDLCISTYRANSLPSSKSTHVCVAQYGLVWVLMHDIRCQLMSGRIIFDWCQRWWKYEISLIRSMSVAFGRLGRASKYT